MAEAWAAAARDPDALVFSVMTGCVVGVDDGDVRRRARAVMARHGDTGSEDDWLAGHGDDWVLGTVDEVVARLAELKEAGVERVMLQHLAHDDVDMVALLGEVARRV